MVSPVEDSPADEQNLPTHAPKTRAADGRSPVTRDVELLAPAGNWDCARAAIENGADAIYFGLDIGFNARARAANFHVRELRQLMLMLHRQGVLGYVTLNTLVFTDELPSLEENVRILADSGVDAVLVQDLGVARLLRELCPDLVVHASTQMTLTNAASIEMARRLGVQRVVLARELSIKEIAKISAETTMPLEAFVHGALCVAYSGQCLTSESLGGRSANRGQCAQACRMPYELFKDGERQDLGDMRYLLSPQDLAAHDWVPQLIDAGICSLKIEGRLKTPEYVSNVVTQYRAAIDEALAGRARRLSAVQREELELSFSRGFSPGWFEGCDHKRLVPGLSSAKRGVLVGEVLKLHGDAILIRLATGLRTGDGIVLEGDRFASQEIGGRVYELFRDGESISHAADGQVNVCLQRGALAGREIRPGCKVWKTDDPQLTRRLRASYNQADPQKRVPVQLLVQVKPGEPIVLRASTADATVEWQSEHVPEVARKHAVSTEQLQEQLSRLGGTIYRLEDLSAEIDGNPMVPLSVLGTLRKQLVAKLDEARITQPIACAAEAITPRMLAAVRTRGETEVAASSEIGKASSNVGSTEPELRVLCRSLSQLDAALAAGTTSLIADFHDLRQYRDAVRIAHAADATLEIATLRIHKPGEDGLFIAIEKHQPDRWLVRNLAALQYCLAHQLPFACDFSMNVTNPLTAEQLMQWGATRITASYDLNRDQLLEMAAEIPAAWLEVVIHQHMPMFHMEHCVFCSVISPGKNKSDCGRPCDRHEVKLQDQVGANHVLHADIGCRNTLYNGTAQSGAEAVKPLLNSGVRQFRIELLNDASPPEIQRLIELYRGLLNGSRTGTEVWQELKAHNRVGVTRGTLEQPRNPLAIL